MNKETLNSSALMDQRAAAAYLGTTVGTLNTWRHYGKQKIPFMRWGNRIRFRKSDLDAYIEASIISPTDKPSF